MQNFCNVAVMVLIDFRMRFVDLDLDFVEHRFSANEKITRCWVGSPYDRGSAVNLSAELTRVSRRSRTERSPVRMISSGCSMCLFFMLSV